MNESTAKEIQRSNICVGALCLITGHVLGLFRSKHDIRKKTKLKSGFPKVNHCLNKSIKSL